MVPAVKLPEASRFTSPPLSGGSPAAVSAAPAAADEKRSWFPTRWLGLGKTRAAEKTPHIVHVDVDAFFASVEQAQHPHLRGRPVIVCGDPSRRGVVTAASYEARPSGVHAGMPLAEARRLCPHAEFVEGNPRKYVEKSLELLEIFLSVTPDVEPFSIDEAFLDLRHLGERGATPETARALRSASRSASPTSTGSAHRSASVPTSSSPRWPPA